MDAIRDRVTALAVDLTGYDPTDLDPGIPLVELGFDSLILTQFASRLSRTFGVTISFRDFFTSIRTLDAIVAKIGSEAPTSPAATQASRSAPAMATGAVSVAGDLASILSEQLAVMARQLEMLAGAPAAAPSFAPAQARASAPRAAPPLKPPDTRSGPTPHQEAAVEQIISEWSARTPTSKRLTELHRPHHADPRTAAGFDPRWKEIAYPLVVKRSEGGCFWDADDNRYVDILSGFGPTFFGHAAPFIAEAVRAQLDVGYEIGPQTPLAGEAARLICEMTGLDRASFVCTGSEAVQAAIRAARTVTGRDKIVVFTHDYHGNFDEVLVRGLWTQGQPRTVPSAPGIPQRAVDDVVVLDYGSDRALEIIRARAGELAAVMVEPVQSRHPELQPREFLHALRQITRDAGVALIFDEVVTGFRCHPGGAQAVFGVEADLVTYGKVLGGGLPIGVVAGRRPFIDVFDGGPWAFGDDSAPTQGVTFFAGTFVRHPLSIAAAHAALRYLEDAGPRLQEDLNARTESLVRDLNAIAREADARIQVSHFSSIMYFRVSEPRTAFDSFFFHVMRLNGVYLLENYPSYLTLAHTDEQLDQVREAFRSSVRRMREGRLWPAPEADGAHGPAALPDQERLLESPVPGARLGRDADGTAAWFIEDPKRAGVYVRVG